MREIWKDIKGYEELYQVSNLGRVKSLPNRYYRKEGKILTNKVTANGYCHLRLSKNGVAKNYLVHRLVAQAFIPNPNKLPIINHKDEIKTNNIVWINDDGSIDYSKSNLEWCDAKYNVNYGNGTIKRVRTNQENGTYQKIGEINRRNFSIPIVNMITYDIYPSTREAERATGIDNRQINNCLKGRQNTTKGYTWEYLENVPLLGSSIVYRRIDKYKKAV